MQKNIQCPLRFLKWVSVDYQPKYTIIPLEAGVDFEDRCQ